GDADHPVPDLHDSVLDVERYPHDLVDPAARPQWPRQPGAAWRASDRRATRMAALLEFLGGARLRPPFHILHDRADLQRDDADRPFAPRSGARRWRQRLAGDPRRGAAV